jgi:hypothetical protein
MASQKSHGKDATGKVILGELHSRENARFLRSMPAFKLDEALPLRLAGLLDDLRRAEDTQRVGGDQSGALGAASGPQRR